MESNFYGSMLNLSLEGKSGTANDSRALRQCQGIFSDCYRRLDNLELCAAVLTVIQEMQGSQIESCEVTPTHLYLKVVNRRLKAEVRVGDVVQAGFVVFNSEVGLGSLRVEVLVFRLACKNGLICKDLAQKKYTSDGKLMLLMIQLMNCMPKKHWRKTTKPFSLRCKIYARGNTNYSQA